MPQALTSQLEDLLPGISCNVNPTLFEWGLFGGRSLAARTAALLL
jgi:hypothetical protein